MVAVMLSKDSQKQFFVKLFGAAWAEQNISPLLAQGVTLNVEFYLIKATLGGVTNHVTLSVSTSAMLKGGVPQESLDANLDHIKQFVASLHAKYLGLPVFDPAAAVPIPAVHKPKIGEIEAMGDPVPGKPAAPAPKPKPATAMSDEEIAAGLGLQQVGQVHDSVVYQKVPKPQPVAQVIHLRDANAVGQRVFGTTEGSVYTVIALNPRVKLAARLQGQNLSVRAEFAGATSSEMNLLKALGLQAKDEGKYMSVHMALLDVPVGRVVGAMLMDSGIDFEDQINGPGLKTCLNGSK